MPAPDPPTPIQACLDRFAAGNPSARDDLIRACRDRLLAMTRRLMARYPAVRRWVESDDVLQNALIRLGRALDSLPVATTSDLLALAATSVRREVIDLIRHYYGVEGVGTHHATPAADHPHPFANTTDPAVAAEWAELHDRVGRLPPEERDVVHLHAYLGMTHAEAAERLGVSERTVKRRYMAARLRLAPAVTAGVLRAAEKTGPI